MYLCMSKCPYIHTLLPCPELLDTVLKTLIGCFILTLSFLCNSLKKRDCFIHLCIFCSIEHSTSFTVTLNMFLGKHLFRVLIPKYSREIHCKDAYQTANHTYLWVE